MLSSGRSCWAAPAAHSLQCRSRGLSWQLPLAKGAAKLWRAHLLSLKSSETSALAMASRSGSVPTISKPARSLHQAEHRRICNTCLVVPPPLVFLAKRLAARNLADGAVEMAHERAQGVPRTSLHGCQASASIALDVWPGRRIRFSLRRARVPCTGTSVRISLCSLHL